MRGGARPAYKVVAADINTLIFDDEDNLPKNKREGLPFYKVAYDIQADGTLGHKTKALWPSPIHEGVWFWKKQF